MGFLLGFLIGLSASPVVGSVVGGLTALLVTFFGLRNPDAEAGGPSAGEAASIREARVYTVGAFGLLATVGVAAGLFVRTHDLLSMSPQERVRRWMDAGFPESEARAVARFELTGILPSGATIPEDRDLASPGSSLLFAGRKEQCDRLDLSQLGDAESLRNAFLLEGEPWASIAGAVASLPPSDQVQALEAVRRLACGES